mgnify:CR=1 FL=1
MIRLIINEIVKCGRVKILTSYFVFTFVTFFIYILNENIIEYSYLNSYVMFIGIYASMLFGGIISNEVEKGTIRFYLSKPVKRWKIYLAKLLTIIFTPPVTRSNKQKLPKINTFLSKYNVD